MELLERVQRRATEMIQGVDLSYGVDPRGTPFLWGQAERAGAVQPGEEEAAGRPESRLSVSEEELQERREIDSGFKMVDLGCI